MVFSSPEFLFFFLPVVLLAHQALPSARWRNAVLLGASLLYYAWGEGAYAWVLLFTWAFTWVWGLLLGRSRGLWRRPVLWSGIGVLLGLLAWFKYRPFFLAQAAWLLGRPAPVLAPQHLPLGISFFMFQALSYLADVGTGAVAPEPSLPRFALYKSFFPQLIAGPIVRYTQMKDQLAARGIGLARFADGARRFSLGLAKKVLLADAFGAVADRVWAQPADGLSPALAWTALGAYALQIFFDFSGYSDMAIGLAALFGFDFPENFNLPYTATSVRDFWRRWHMTLSAWFRDYVYLPLGGGRRGPWRTALNLWAVFLLCGLWHGASWNFILWGAWYGLFLSLEHGLAGRGWPRPPAWLGWLYAQSVVLAGWVLFRSPDLAAAGVFLRALAGAHGVYARPVGFFTQPVSWFLAAVGAALALGSGHALLAWSRRDPARGPHAYGIVLESLAAALLLVLALGGVAGGAYHAFLYFRF